MPERKFTAEEDDLIRLNAEGRISISSLLKLLKTSRETLELRAADLGIDLRVGLQGGGNQEVALDAHTAPGRSPYSVGTDLLLQRLREIHSERQYESLELQRRRK